MADDRAMIGRSVAHSQTVIGDLAASREFRLEDFIHALGRLQEPSEIVPDSVREPMDRLRIVEHMFSVPGTRQWLINQADMNMSFLRANEDTCERTLGSLFQAWSNVALVYDGAGVRDQMPEWFPVILRLQPRAKEEYIKARRQQHDSVQRVISSRMRRLHNVEFVKAIAAWQPNSKNSITNKAHVMAIVQQLCQSEGDAGEWINSEVERHGAASNKTTSEVYASILQSLTERWWHVIDLYKSLGLIWEAPGWLIDRYSTPDQGAYVDQLCNEYKSTLVARCPQLLDMRGMSGAPLSRIMEIIDNIASGWNAQKSHGLHSDHISLDVEDFERAMRDMWPHAAFQEGFTQHEATQSASQFLSNWIHLLCWYSQAGELHKMPRWIVDKYSSRLPESCKDEHELVKRYYASSTSTKSTTSSQAATLSTVFDVQSNVDIAALYQDRAKQYRRQLDADLLKEQSCHRVSQRATNYTSLAEKDAFSHDFQEAAKSFSFKDEMEANPTTVLREHRQRIIHRLCEIPQVLEHLVARVTKHNENNDMQNGQYRCCIELFAPWTNVLYLCKSLGVLDQAPREFVDAHQIRSTLVETDDALLVDEYFTLIAQKKSSAAHLASCSSSSTATMVTLDGFIASSDIIFTEPEIQRINGIVANSNHRKQLLEYMWNMNHGTRSWLEREYQSHISGFLASDNPYENITKSLFCHCGNVMAIFETQAGGRDKAPVWFVEAYRDVLAMMKQLPDMIDYPLQIKRKLTDVLAIDRNLTLQSANVVSGVETSSTSLVEEFLAQEKLKMTKQTGRDTATASSSCNNYEPFDVEGTEEHCETDYSVGLATILKSVATIGTITSDVKHVVPVAQEDHVPIVEHIFANIPDARKWLLQYRGTNKPPSDRNLSDLRAMLSNWLLVVQHYQECGVIHLIPAWFVEKYAAAMQPDYPLAPIMKLTLQSWRQIMSSSASEAEKAVKLQMLFDQVNLQQHQSKTNDNGVCLILDELLHAVSNLGTLTSRLPQSVPVAIDDRARIVRHLCETQPRAIGWLQGRGPEIAPGMSVDQFLIDMMKLLLSDWVMILDQYQMDDMLAHTPRWFIDKYRNQIQAGDVREPRIRRVIESYMDIIDELYKDESEVENIDTLFASGRPAQTHPDVLTVAQGATTHSAAVAVVNRRLEAIAFGKLFCGTR